MAASPFLPCPFCGSTNLLSGEWSLEHYDGEAIECADCAAGAPANVWNRRAGADDGLPASIQEALNSGDGTYRP